MVEPYYKDNLSKHVFLFRNAVCSLLRFGILELRNRVKQNDVKLRVTNSKMFVEIPLSSY